MSDKRLFQDDGSLSQELIFAIEQASARVAEKYTNPFPKELIDNLTHLTGMFTDIGDGDASKGIERTREQYKYFVEVREFHKKVTNWVAGTIVVTIIAGMLGLMVYGFWHKAKG